MGIDGEYREEVERDTIREEGTIECPFTGITLNKREKTFYGCIQPLRSTPAIRPSHTYIPYPHLST